MRWIAPIFATTLVGIGFLGCFDNQVAGGNSAGTDNTTARRIPVDSVLSDWNRPFRGATVATLRLNSGNFDFLGSDSIGRDLVVLKENGDSIPFNVVYWDRLEQLGRLEVRIDSTLLAPRARFLLKWHQAIQQRSSRVAVWQSISDSQRLVIGSVLVADFENGTDTTLLPTRPVWGTSFVKDSSTISPLAFLPAGGTRQGTALSVTYKTTGSYFVVIKTSLVAGDGARNLRSIDSLVFYAKGTKGSSLFTALEHDTSFKAWKLDTLDTLWKRIRIRPSDFLAPGVGGSGNRGWVAVRDSVTDLTFILNNGTSFLLDDIRLYGINRDDLR